MNSRHWTPDAVVSGLIVLLLAAGAVLGIAHEYDEVLDAAAARGLDVDAFQLSVLLLFGSMVAGGAAFLGPSGKSVAWLQWRDVRDESWWARERCLGLAAAAAVGVAAAGILAWYPHEGGAWGAWLVVTYVLLGVGISWASYEAQRMNLAPVIVGGSLALLIGSVAVFAVAAADPAGAVLLFLVVPLARGLRRVGPAMRPDVPPRWSLIRAHENRWAFGASVTMLDGTVRASVRSGRETATAWTPPVPTRAWAQRLAAAILFAVRLRANFWLIACIGGYLALKVGTYVTPTTASGLMVLLFAGLVVAGSDQSDMWHVAPALRRTFRTLEGHGWVWITLGSTVVCTALGALAVLAWDLPAQIAAVLLVTPAVLQWRRNSLRSSDEHLWVTSPMGAVPLSTVARVVSPWDAAAGVLVVLGLL